MFHNNSKSVMWFFDETGIQRPINFKKRKELYDECARLVVEPALYIEFGVYKGRSLKYWSTKLKDAKSALVALDTFQGLPSNWEGGKMAKGTFTTNGELPKIKDDRIQYLVGLIQDNIDSIKIPKGTKTILVNVDSDMPDVANCIFNWLGKIKLPKGTIVMLDEFAVADEGEARAFQNYISKSKTKWQPIGRTTSWNRVAFIKV